MKITALQDAARHAAARERLRCEAVCADLEAKNRGLAAAADAMDDKLTYGYAAVVLAQAQALIRTGFGA